MFHILLPFARLLIAASEAKHRGFAFVTFTAVSDAQDAIDNMDMNEFHNKVIRVNLAKPSKQPMQGGGNRAGMLYILLNSISVSYK